MHLCGRHEVEDNDWCVLQEKQPGIVISAAGKEHGGVPIPGQRPEVGEARRAGVLGLS